MLVIFILLGVFGVSQSFSFPPRGICITTEKSLKCICKNRENFSISSNLNYDITWISVEGCGAITVPWSAITGLHLESFIFTDIDQLEIKAFALVGVETIDLFKIEDIRDFKVRKNGFVGLNNTLDVIIRNVSSNSLDVSSFGSVENINNFLIENSNFGEVPESAFILTNINNITFANCTFNIFQNKSLIIHNSGSVLFVNCDIQEATDSSFFMSTVTSLSFINCHFGILASTFILTHSLETFRFQQCYVEELKTDAFIFVDATEKFIFTYNTIKIADEYSLIPSTGTNFSNSVEIEDCCNELTCDCYIFWLWKPRKETAYKSLLENSYCIEKPEINVSNLMPVLDSSENCMTLELKTRNPNAKPSVSNDKSAQSKVSEFILIYLFILLGLSLFFSSA